MKNRVWNSYLCNWKTGPKKVFRMTRAKMRAFDGDFYFTPRLARDIYNMVPGRYGRGRGSGSRGGHSMSYNDTPSNDSFVGRGRGSIGRGRGFYSTASSSSDMPDFSNSRAGRGLRRVMERWGIDGGRGRPMRTTWSSSESRGNWAGSSGA